MRRLRRFWTRLSPQERTLARTALDVLLVAVARLVWRRLLAAGVASAAIAAGTVVATHQLAGPAAPDFPPIKTAWLTRAGPFPVDRITVPCLDDDVDQDIAPKGVGHTTEGSWDSSLAVFRRHYAPTFMVGRDSSGRVRIAQLCPLGKTAAALENHAGGVETNRWARAQIELVAHSQHTIWRPDAQVLAAFAALLYQLRDSAGIPLAHVANPERDAAIWQGRAGWFDHAGVPENSHWDMGAFDWPAVLTAAHGFAPRAWLVCWTPYPQLPHCVETRAIGTVVEAHATARRMTLRRRG